MAKSFVVRVTEVEPEEESSRREGRDIRWLITDRTTPTQHGASFRAVSPPGIVGRKHKHTNVEELVYVIRGEGILTIEDQEHPVAGGTAIYIPRGAVHKIRNTSQTELLEVLGTYIGAVNQEQSGWTVVEDASPVS